MKKDSSTLILVALLVAAGGYWYFFTGSEEQPTIVSGIEENQAQTQFQILMSALPLSFEASIFEDPRFQSLINISTPVTSEPSGRPDPFAALSSAASF